MRARMIAAILLAAVACGGDDGDGDGGPDAGTIDVSGLLYEPCQPAFHVGGFDIILDDEFTAVQGQVFDAVSPSRQHEVIRREGDCAWMRAPTLVCNPSCGVGTTCTPQGTCTPTPVAVTAGTVTAEGLRAAVSMEPRAPAFFYSFTGDLPHPGFTPGAGMRVRGDGFELLGWGIEALETASSTIEMQRDTPLVLSWGAPSLTGPSKIEISVNINGHGLVGSHLECVVDDTGSYTIPATLINDLMDDGLSGFPSLTIRRTTTDNASVAGGCIELDVESSDTIDITIPGLTSCDGDEDCTPPETCQPDLTCG